MQKSDFNSFASKYCETQVCTHETLLSRLKLQIKEFKPTGWLLAQCEDMCSSRLGHQVILPYGPNNNYKELPANGLINPYGSATFVVKAYLLSEDCRENADV
jgi:hypothetical protein